MLVKELISELQKVDGESRVFMAYDGNIVVTEPESVIVASEEIISPICWWPVKSGDTVILCAE